MLDTFPKAPTHNVYRKARKLGVAGAVALIAAGCGGPRNTFKSNKYTVAHRSLPKGELPATDEFEVPRSAFKVLPHGNKGKTYDVIFGGVIGCEGSEEPDRLTVTVPSLHDGTFVAGHDSCDTMEPTITEVTKNDPFLKDTGPVEVIVHTNGQFDWSVGTPNNDPRPEMNLGE